MTETPTADSEIDFTQILDAILSRVWVVALVWVATIASVAFYIYTTTPIFEASSMVIIEKERGSGAVYSNGSQVENKNDDYYRTQYKLLKSNSLLQKVYDGLHLENAPEFAGKHGLQQLASAITINPVLGSRLVYLHAESADPKLAMQLSNTLAETFVSENLANQLFISKEVLQTLQVSANDPKARQMYESLPTVVANPLVQGLKSDFSKLESQSAELSQKVTPKHPSMLAIRSNMMAVQAQIRVETDKVVQSLKTELSGQLKGNNVRIIDMATLPESPVRPKKKALVPMALIGGLLLGMGVAFLLDFLDQSVRTQKDIEEKLGLPFLGSIPMVATRKGKNAHESLLAPEQSLTSEAFRNLRTMVDFAGLAGKAQQILVTSSVQEEGKSYIASNLAVAFAQHGESVVLIDGDLRRPKIHKNFSLSAKQGLSDFLATGLKVDDIEKLLQPTDVPNLKVLVCGTRPPNPSELLNTPRVGALLNWAKENFDRVIIDCTPMFPINDTLLWGRHVRSTVFVCRYGKTRVPLIKTANKKLLSAGLQVLGVTLNSAKTGGLSYTGYNYYYQQYLEEPTQTTKAA